MRPTGLVLFVALAAVLAAATAGCEKEEPSQLEPTTGPSQPQFQPLKLATKPATLPLPPPDWKPTTERSLPGVSTAPSTEATGASSRPADALATPDSAVRYFLQLNSGQDLPDMQNMLSILVEPPPDEELVPRLNRVRRRLLNGAVWEILESHEHGAAGVVVYRTTYRGRTEMGSLLLLRQHERWKIVLGELTPSRYTSGEKSDMMHEAQWNQGRMAQLAAAATQATTRPATQADVQPPTTPSALPAPR
jgi:hypothetical protein